LILLELNIENCSDSSEAITRSVLGTPTRQLQRLRSLAKLQHSNAGENEQHGHALESADPLTRYEDADNE
jgi:hypothetical protein